MENTRPNYNSSSRPPARRVPTRRSQRSSGSGVQIQIKSQRNEDKITPLEFPIEKLQKMKAAELGEVAKKLEIKTAKGVTKDMLVSEILKKQATAEGKLFVDGILEVTGEGAHGLLRDRDISKIGNDAYVSQSQIRRFGLRRGDLVIGQARAPKEGEKYLSLLQIIAVNGKSPDSLSKRTDFRVLTPIFPNKQMKLETEQLELSTRIIDLLCPIGFGQRAMVVSPPKAGKTILLKDLAKGIGENHPDIQLIVVLIGERPEEVTDIRRSVKGEVYASNFDEAPEEQVRVAELALTRAKRIVEAGDNVVILMDSITRLARAYNVITPPSGRTLSGGFDPIAIYPPKRFFGAGRNFEEGPSLTVIATALVDTGSKMDAVIFEEFKGTGNMEIHLSRKLAEKRVYPAIDVVKSSTRNEELLLDKETLSQSWKIRKLLDELGENQATEALIDRLKRTKSNKEFLKSLHEAM